MDNTQTQEKLCVYKAQNEDKHLLDYLFGVFGNLSLQVAIS